MRTFSYAVAIALLVSSAAAVAQQGQSQIPQTSLSDPILPLAKAQARDKLELPALDNGALVDLAVQKGQAIQQGDTIGRIDDTEAVMTHAVALAQLETAQENAGEGSRIQLDFANKAAAVARHVYETKKDAWTTRQAVTAMEVQEAQLEYEKSIAQIDVRKFEQKMAGVEVGAKQAEVEAAEKAIQRRHLVAPFSGVIEEVHRRKGEWVQAGEKIVFLMNLETMLVTANVDGSVWSRQDVDGRPVTVIVQQPGHQQVELKGTITAVSQRADASNNQFAVQAEVANQKIGNHWVLADGAMVTMTIHVNN